MEGFSGVDLRKLGTDVVDESVGNAISESLSADGIIVSDDGGGEEASGLANVNNSLGSVGKIIDRNKNGLRCGVTDVEYPTELYNWDFVSSLLLTVSCLLAMD